jgi:transposase
LELLPGILRVLRSGCRWRDLNLPGYPSGVTHWRRLRFWKREAYFRELWEMLLRLLRTNKLLQLKQINIDGSLMPSYAFKDKTSYSGKHHKTGVKISTLSEGSGIPIAMVVAKGNIVDITLADNTVDSIRIAQSSVKGSILNGDKGYDCLDFRKSTSRADLVPNIPKRKCTSVRDKDVFYYLYMPLEGKKRYIIERTNAWLKSFKRLRFRFDYTSTSFEAFLYLAIIVICVRRLLP